MINTGNGGYVIIAGSPNVTAHNGMWTLNKMNRLGEVTNSAYGGSQYAPCLQDPSWTIEIPRDDTLFPEALGLIQGTFITTLWFKLGSVNKADRLDATTVESVNEVCDNKGDVIRVTVTGKGGMVTNNQSLPA
jgi:hypothetical protein